MGGVGVDHLARFRRLRLLSALGHVDEAVALARIAEGNRRRDLGEIVGAERQHMRERHRVVEIDECVHAREWPAREHVLDQPLDRGAIARLLDAEAFVGGAPRRDTGNLRQLRAAPRRASRLLPFGDQRIERGGTFGRDGEPFGDDDRDAIGGKCVGDVGDRDLHDATRSLCIRPTADYRSPLDKINIREAFGLA